MWAYQRHAEQHIIDTPKCGLFLDMGLGKTVSTLTALERLMYDSFEVRKAVVIAPKRVAESVWAQEVRKWAHLKHLRVSVVAGTPKQREQALKADADIYTVGVSNTAWLCGLYGGSKLPFDVIVIDELSCFKSPKSQRFKALRQVSGSASRVIGLTGTPAPNGLIDLWSQLYLLDRGERLGKTITYYRNRFFREGKRNGAIVYKYDPLEGSSAEVEGLISDICISMKANDYLDMPDRVDNFIKLSMPTDVAKAYKDFEREKVLELIDGSDDCITVANAAALTNKLLQMAGGAVYDEDRNVVHVHDVKLDALEELIDSANGKPLLVAYAFKHEKDRILERFKQATELKTDADVVKWNAGKTPLLLVHPAGAGHGLNLQAGGNNVVWFGHTWSSELFQQLNTRLLRQGQAEKSVFFHYLVVEGTADEDVIRAIEGKVSRQDALLDALKARVQNYTSEKRK